MSLHFDNVLFNSFREHVWFTYTPLCAVLCMDTPCCCRGYLARGVLFRGEGRQGDAERMFLQARYIAPKESRALVDKVIGPT